MQGFYHMLYKNDFGHCGAYRGLKGKGQRRKGIQSRKTEN